MQGQRGPRGPRDPTEDLSTFVKLLDWQWSVALQQDAHPILRADDLLPHLKDYRADADVGMMESLLQGHRTWKYTMDSGQMIFWREEGPSQQQLATTSTLPQPAPTAWDGGQQGATGPGNEWTTTPAAHYNYDQPITIPIVGDATSLPLQHHGGIPWPGSPLPGPPGGMTLGTGFSPLGGKGPSGTQGAQGTSLSPGTQSGATMFVHASATAEQPTSGGAWNSGSTTNVLPPAGTAMQRTLLNNRPPGIGGTRGPGLQDPPGKDHKGSPQLNMGKGQPSDSAADKEAGLEYRPGPTTRPPVDFGDICRRVQLGEVILAMPGVPMDIHLQEAHLMGWALAKGHPASLRGRPVIDAFQEGMIKACDGASGGTFELLQSWNAPPATEVEGKGGKLWDRLSSRETHAMEQPWRPGQTAHRSSWQSGRLDRYEMKRKVVAALTQVRDWMPVRRDGFVRLTDLYHHRDKWLPPESVDAWNQGGLGLLVDQFDDFQCEEDVKHGRIVRSVKPTYISGVDWDTKDRQWLQPLQGLREMEFQGQFPGLSKHGGAEQPDKAPSKKSTKGKGGQDNKKGGDGKKGGEQKKGGDGRKGSQSKDEEAKPYGGRKKVGNQEEQRQSWKQEGSQWKKGVGAPDNKDTGKGGDARDDADDGVGQRRDYGSTAHQDQMKPGKSTLEPSGAAVRSGGGSGQADSPTVGKSWMSDAPTQAEDLERNFGQREPPPNKQQPEGDGTGNGTSPQEEATAPGSDTHSTKASTRDPDSPTAHHQNDKLADAGTPSPLRPSPGRNPRNWGDSSNNSAETDDDLPEIQENQ